MSTHPIAKLKRPVDDTDHYQGSPNAAIILVEYGDYECPFCGAAYADLKEIQQALGDKLGFVFRNFPLAEMHPHARDAAQATEAAGAQKAFWQMHDTLYENQEDLALENIARYAEALGLDAARLINEIESGLYAKRVQDDFRGGVRSGVNGTPTFFINDIRYDGPHDVASMVKALSGQS